MQRGPVIAFVVEGEDAVATVRKIVGSTYPNEAQPGSIRGDFAHQSKAVAIATGKAVANLVHASGNREEAEYEVDLWFDKTELFEYRDHGRRVRLVTRRPAVVAAPEPRRRLLAGQVGRALAQHVLLDLAGRGLRQLGDEGDAARGLEVGQVLPRERDDRPPRWRWRRRWSTTKACGVSPHFSSGRPTIAASCTAGWRSSTPSTSTEEMFSPPLMITSLSRSRISA